MPRHGRSGPPRARRRRALSLVAVALLLAASTAACGDDGGDAAAPSPTPTQSAPTTSAPTTPTSDGPVRPRAAETVATGFDVPWDLAFLPDGSALVTERDTAQIKRVRPNGRTTVVGTVPGVVPDGEGGLLGITLSPDFAEDDLLYAYITTGTDNRIVRMTYRNGELGAPQVVLAGIEKSSIHNGGRIAFGPDGYLYAGVGDAGDTTSSQNRKRLNGKILRITSGGAPAPDNPYPDSPVYSFGHRNVQGLAWDSRDQLWASEFGQNTWDELNRVDEGGNYGWPIVEGEEGGAGFVDPERQWATADASPSGIAIVRDHVLMAALRGERLWVIPVDAEGTGEPQAYLTGEFGRLRTAVAAPDGSVWVLTNNTGRGAPREGDDRILRVTV
jgi:glucose/arabinose dehydrogenase